MSPISNRQRTLLGNHELQSCTTACGREDIWAGQGLRDKMTGWARESAFPRYSQVTQVPQTGQQGIRKSAGEVRQTGGR